MIKTIPIYFATVVHMDMWDRYTLFITSIWVMLVNSYVNVDVNVDVAFSDLIYAFSLTFSIYRPF
jgi:hypothetical protein